MFLQLIHPLLELDEAVVFSLLLIDIVNILLEFNFTVFNEDLWLVCDKMCCMLRANYLLSILLCVTVVWCQQPRNDAISITCLMELHALHYLF